MANSRKKHRRRKTLSVVLILLAFLIAGAAVGVKLLRQRVTEAYGTKSNDNVQKATVTVGSISTTITGSGTLSAQDTTDVSIPASVSIRSLCVEEGATVAEGDVLAYLDLTSTALSVRDITERLAFNTPNYFIQSFRALEGLTPAQYRRQVRQAGSAASAH